FALEEIAVFTRADRLGQEPERQLAAGAQVLGAAVRFAEIGHHREAAVPAHAQPGTARFQIAPAEHLRRIRPPVRGAGRALMELVAVTGKDQRIARMNLPGDGEQAHASIMACLSGNRRCSGEGGKTFTPHSSTSSYPHDRRPRNARSVSRPMAPRMSSMPMAS